jgi:ribosomal protein S18 acetylase RimI-like enzyme
MEIKIEEAKKKDINSLLKLVKEMTEYHLKFDDFYKEVEEQKKDFKKLLSKKIGKRDFKVLIAKEKGQILGHAIGFIRKAPFFAKPKRIGHLMHLIVKEKYRRKGIGRMLFEKILEWFKERGIKHIELNVDSRNEIAISAYKKYGFFEFQKRMRLDL